MTTNPKRGRPHKLRLPPDEHLRLDRANLHHRAGSVLRALIVRGKLEPGETLIEVRERRAALLGREGRP